MSVAYSRHSPYFNNESFGPFLDVSTLPSIPYDPTDVVYEIDAIYKHRPDLLAYDLYDNSALYWVFSARNPNTMKDPIFDFLPGATIYIPKKATLTAILGI
jgi:hypothetical protein